MKLKAPSPFAALLLSAACMSPLFAAYQGVKGSISLTLTATSEVGAFKIKDADLEKFEAMNPSVSYDSIRNPLGFNAEATMANYYAGKRTIKVKDYGTTEDGEHMEDFHATSSVYEESTQLVTQQLVNATLIKQMAARTYVPASAASGYRLVVIFPADRPESDTPPALFFIENSTATSIYYVGRQASYFGTTDTEIDGYGATGRDALLISFSDLVESYTYKSTTNYKHVQVSDDEGGKVWEFDDEGTTTVSDSFTGKSQASVTLFPTYHDSASDSYLNHGDVFYFSGLAAYSGYLETFKDNDSANDLYVTKSASLAAGVSTGSFYGDYDTEAGYYRTYGLVTGGFNISAPKVAADITPYLDAIPAELSWLKDAIIANYSASPE